MSKINFKGLFYKKSTTIASAGNSPENNLIAKLSGRHLYIGMYFIFFFVAGTSTLLIYLILATRGSRLRLQKTSKLTFNTQLLLTNKLLGLISRWRIFAECRYFKPKIKEHVGSKHILSLWRWNQKNSLKYRVFNLPRSIWYRKTLIWSDDKCCGETIILWRSLCNNSVITYLFNALRKMYSWMSTWRKKSGKYIYTQMNL